MDQRSPGLVFIGNGIRLLGSSSEIDSPAFRSAQTSCTRVLPGAVRGPDRHRRGRRLSCSKSRSECEGAVAASAACGPWRWPARAPLAPATGRVLERWVGSGTGPSLRTLRTADPSPFVTLTVTTPPARPCRGPLSARATSRTPTVQQQGHGAESEQQRGENKPDRHAGLDCNDNDRERYSDAHVDHTGPRVTAAASGTAGGACASEQQRSTVGATVPRPCARAWPEQRRSHRQRPRAWSQTAAA